MTASSVAVPSPALQLAELQKVGSWPLPTNLVLALPSASLVRDHVAARQAKGDWALPISRVFLQVDRYFAEIGFIGDRHTAVVFAIDVWPLGAKLGAGADRLAGRPLHQAAGEGGR